MAELKEINGKEVELAALLLLEAHPKGETTNLEVKQLLRILGYSATQEQVSFVMTQVVNDLDLEVRYVGGVEGMPVYRVYSHPDDEIDEPEPELKEEEVVLFIFRVEAE